MFMPPDPLEIERLSCSGEYTYEKGEPLEVSAHIKVSHPTEGEAVVQIEVFRKNLWSYERIYVKRIQNTGDFSEPRRYIICIPGYETGEFKQEQQLKMRVGVTMNGESASKEAFWKVSEG